MVYITRLAERKNALSPETTAQIIAIATRIRPTLPRSISTAVPVAQFVSLLIKSCHGITTAVTVLTITYIKPAIKVAETMIKMVFF